jgi:hypothetical protein
MLTVLIEKKETEELTNGNAKDAGSGLSGRPDHIFHEPTR